MSKQKFIIKGGEHDGKTFELTDACTWKVQDGVLWNCNTDHEEAVEGDIIEYTNPNGVRYRGHVRGYTCYQFIETEEWGGIVMPAQFLREHWPHITHQSKVELIKGNEENNNNNEPK